MAGGTPERVTVAAALAGGLDPRPDNHRGTHFDTLIDVRSPAEFAEDRLPGAENWPVLDDEERARVGTLYVQDSPLAARKLGAALVARRIAGHLDAHLADKARGWRPLVYCWRGGQRSGSLALVLAQIGFRSAQLQGGYKAFRAQVRQDLETMPAGYRFRVLCGRTGSGKTRLLAALAAAGAQVLDLEALAEHRGSVLGGFADRAQPTQKHFDTRVWHALSRFDPAEPVFVESESARIGQLRVPPAVLAAMHEQGDCVQVVTGDEVRTALLLEDYRQSMLDPAALARLLATLVELRGREKVAAWQALAGAERWPELIRALMHDHYDPLYQKSMQRSYPRLEAAPRVTIDGTDDAAMHGAAERLLGSGRSTDPSA